MRFCHRPHATPAETSAIDDRLLCVDAPGQELAADRRLLAVHATGEVPNYRHSDDTTLFDLLTCTKTVGLMRAAKLCHGSDFWGLGVDANGIAVPPCNAVFMVTLQRLLHGSCMYRDHLTSARTSASRSGERLYADELYDWGVLFPDAVTSRGPAVGVLHVGQECALWYDLLDGVSLYRPVTLTAVHHVNGLDERYVVAYTYLDELAHLGELIMDLGPSDIDTRDARLLTGIVDVRSCWDVARQHQLRSSPPPPPVSKAFSSRSSSMSSTERMVLACAPTPGAGTCMSPLSVSSGVSCPGAPLRASSFMSMGSQEMLDRADCMSDDFAFEDSDVVAGTTPFVDADLDDLARFLGEDDPDLVVPSPPPFSPASSMSTLSDDMPLVPLGRGVRYFPGEYVHDGMCFDDARLRVGRSVTMW